MMADDLGAMQIAPQLTFRGQCREAFEHYEKVLRGKITVMNSFGDNDAGLPPGSTAAAHDQIRFAELRIGDYAILGNDVLENEYAPMRGFQVALHVKTGSEVKRIFDALSQDGQIETPLSEVAWSSAFGICTDRFGTPWLILALDK